MHKKQGIEQRAEGLSTEDREQITDIGIRKWEGGIRNDRAKGRGYGVERIAFNRLIFK
jgi:hypothetical protein